MNKITKVLGLSVAALSLAGGIFTTNEVNAKTTKTLITNKKAVKKTSKKKAKGTKYGFKKAFVFSKDLQGKWYSNNNLTPDPLEIGKSTLVLPYTGKKAKAVVIGKVKGTNKYTWQMSGNWKLKHAKAFANVMRGSYKTIDKTKWTILSPVDEKSVTSGFAYTVKDEKIDDKTGETIKVVFEARPDDGKVINQYFTSKDLANKYTATKFADMTYSDINPR
ncbi:hypothetical protein PT287_02805 [Lactobacillus sp. ESL0679]|uniref:hypothetical protein n=1 Tax=Lactobacillus sp. ESL0679 TaxID=2983209 RepID=UPI0023F92F4A|nr:hypothetical protein [Lactobacillus sp. ESL0679]MDF7682451.1 hypothetical protein [Lactobacillus sp. ESL0679]